MARKKMTETQKLHKKYDRMIKKNVKTLNKRIGALKRENARYGVAKDPVLDELINVHREMTGVKSTNKLYAGRLSHMSIAKKRDILDMQAVYLVKGNKGGNHWRHFNTPERAKMRKRTMEKLNYKYFQGKKVLNNHNWAILQNLFSSQHIYEWQQNNVISSDQIVELAAKMDVDQFSRLGDAITEIGKMFPTAQSMQNIWKQDSDAFRDLLLVLTTPEGDARDEALANNDIYQEYHV